MHRDVVRFVTTRATLRKAVSILLSMGEGRLSLQIWVLRHKAVYLFSRVRMFGFSASWFSTEMLMEAGNELNGMINGPWNDACCSHKAHELARVYH